MQEHALNTCVKPVHDAPLQARLVTTPPHHLHGQARAESTPKRVRNSCTHRYAFAMGLREAKAWCSLLKYPTDGQRDSKWNRKGVDGKWIRRIVLAIRQSLQVENPVAAGAIEIAA